jgi:hypothetical protein
LGARASRTVWRSENPASLNLIFRQNRAFTVAVLASQKRNFCYALHNFFLLVATVPIPAAEAGPIAHMFEGGYTFPYPQRQKLLGMLTVSFGPYQRMLSKGISTHYVWKRDDGIGIDLAVTLDPTYGILSLNISGPNSELIRHGQADCADKPSTHKSSK